jgi:hypothetical protein
MTIKELQTQMDRWPSVLHKHSQWGKTDQQAWQEIYALLTVVGTLKLKGQDCSGCGVDPE